MKIAKRIFVIAVCAVLCMMSAVPCTASVVNSQDVSIGDTVTYSLHALYCPTLVRAVDISVTYDSTSLEYIKGSLETPALKGVVTNDSLLGEIRFNAISAEGLEMYDDRVLANISFKVTDDLSDEISLSYMVKNCIDENKDELQDTYIYDVTTVTQSESSETVSESQTDIRADNPENESSGAAVGGEEESAVSAVYEEKHSSNVSNKSQVSSYAVSVIHSDDNPSESMPHGIPSDKAITFETLDTPQSQKHDGKVYLYVMLCAVAIIILIAVVFVIIFKNPSKGNHFAE